MNQISAEMASEFFAAIHRDQPELATQLETYVKELMVSNVSVSDLLSHPMSPVFFYETLLGAIDTLYSPESGVPDSVLDYMNNPLFKITLNALRQAVTLLEGQPIPAFKPVTEANIAKPRSVKTISATPSKPKPKQQATAPSPKVPKVKDEKRSTVYVTIDESIVASVAESLKTTPSYLHQQKSKATCAKYPRPCHYCYKMALHTHLTKCVEVPNHPKDEEGNIIQCHETGWYPHTTRNLWNSRKTIHDKDGAFVPPNNMYNMPTVSVHARQSMIQYETLPANFLAQKVIYTEHPKRKVSNVDDTSSLMSPKRQLVAYDQSPIYNPCSPAWDDDDYLPPPNDEHMASAREIAELQEKCRLAGREAPDTWE